MKFKITGLCLISLIVFQFGSIAYGDDSYLELTNTDSANQVIKSLTQQVESLLDPVAAATREQAANLFDSLVEHPLISPTSLTFVYGYSNLRPDNTIPLRDDQDTRLVLPAYWIAGSGADALGISRKALAKIIYWNPAQKPAEKVIAVVVRQRSPRGDELMVIDTKGWSNKRGSYLHGGPNSKTLVSLEEFVKQKAAAGDPLTFKAFSTAEAAPGVGSLDNYLNPEHFDRVERTRETYYDLALKESLRDMEAWSNQGSSRASVSKRDLIEISRRISEDPFLSQAGHIQAAQQNGTCYIRAVVACMELVNRGYPESSVGLMFAHGRLFTTRNTNPGLPNDVNKDWSFHVTCVAKVKEGSDPLENYMVVDDYTYERQVENLGEGAPPMTLKQWMDAMLEANRQALNYSSAEKPMMAFQFSGRLTPTATSVMYMNDADISIYGLSKEKIELTEAAVAKTDWSMGMHKANFLSLAGWILWAAEKKDGILFEETLLNSQSGRQLKGAFNYVVEMIKSGSVDFMKKSDRKKILKLKKRLFAKKKGCKGILEE